MIDRYKVKKESVNLITRDGIRLDADLYTPDSSERFPVLLMRQPYGRTIASTVVYAHPKWYAERGYIVIIQDVRGRGTSTGDFKLFEKEIDDGFDTLEWAAGFGTGEVGMYGFSYQGMTQLYAASTGHPALKVICPAMIAHDLYEDWAYENGAFNLQYNLAWAIQLAAETARLRGDEGVYNQLYRASRNLPLFDPVPTSPGILEYLAPDSFYHEWAKHDRPSDYWQRLSPEKLLKNVDLPMLHIGGWFDPHLRGTLKLYRDLKERSRFPQHLIIGPWGHLPWSRRLGEMDYGENAISPVDDLQIQWFDYFLKGKDSDFIKGSPLTLFEMGSNRWRDLNGLEPDDRKVYYLKSTGLAGIREDDGRLGDSRDSFDSEDIIVHDPWRPVPSLGGHNNIVGGMFDRSSLDCRADILTYTGEPLEESLTIFGSAVIECYCEADTPSFDLSVTLSLVRPDGKVYNIASGYKRVYSPEQPVILSLQSTFTLVNAGCRLRVSIAGACFPAHPVNDGTGTLHSRTIDLTHITICVFCQGDRGTKITIPIMKL